MFVTTFKPATQTQAFVAFLSNILGEGKTIGFFPVNKWVFVEWNRASSIR